MRNLDIDLVRSFVAIADTGSFTAAGEAVARTQSAVSVQIRRLEETLGQKLLERTTRSIELTREGETFLAYARRILDLNDESIRRLSAPELEGRIRLGITEYFVPDDLPSMLARFARAFPGVELEARMGLSIELREHLAAGRLDAAILRVSRRDRSKPFWKEAQVWVAGESATPEAKTPLPLVLLPEPCVLRAHALEAMKRLSRPYSVVLSASGIRGVQAAVVAGLGISILPKSCVLPGMRILKGLPVPGHLEIGIVKARAARPQLVEAVHAVAVETLGGIAVYRAAA